jgi:hypothetical protein
MSDTPTPPPAPPQREAYTLTIRDVGGIGPPIARLKRLTKAILRVYGYRIEDMRAVTPTTNTKAGKP